MTRLILIALTVLVVLWVLLSLNVLPEPLNNLAQAVVGLACSLTIPGLFLTSYLAPGLLQGVAADVRHFWHRMRTRRRDVDELQRKIAHLNRPYHMHQLGLVYSSQGRTAKARDCFEQALAKDPDSIDSKYQLGACLYAHKEYARAAELLEQVNAKKPEHDYGMNYLRLAQSQHFSGNPQRAAEVYQTLLRFYPGHPEGSYHYALLLAGDHSPQEAAKLMKDLIFTVRYSPGFHRRRNRHWALKARWWLWQHRNDVPAN